MTRRRPEVPRLVDLVREGTIPVPKKPDRQLQLPAGRMPEEDEALLRRYLERQRVCGLADRTLEERRRAMRRLRRRLGKPLLEAAREDLRDWQEGLAGGPSYRRSQTSHVQGFYRWAVVVEELLDKDPSAALPRPRTRPGLPRPISEADLALALTHADGYVRLTLVLAAYAGLRCAEVAGLRCADIVDTAEEPYLRITGKGGKTRAVPVGPAVLAELRAYGPRGRGFVLRRRDGKAGQVRAGTLDNQVNLYLAELGIVSTLHTLRHRYGTRMYKATKDLRVTGQVMGHSDPKTTALYAAVSDIQARPAALDLDAELDGGTA